MNPQSNEYFETGMANLSLGNGTPMAPQHTPNFSGEWDQQDDEPLNQHPSARSSNFIKPAAAQSNKSVIPQDMHIVQDLYDNYSQKVYIEGYIYKKNDLTVDGKSFGDPNWSKVYAELCGPVLTLWDTEFEQDENVMPQYVNITDSNVELLGRMNDRENVFSLNSAGANRYFIDVSDFNTLVNWVCAFRLSCFECSRLQEIYTKIFINRSIYSDILSSKPMNKMEGLVQVRFTGSTEWQKLWVVVSDRKEEKKLFGKKSVKSRGQMMFYESKKSKSPVMTMVNVVQAYTIYPDSPQLIDLATMLKVEGFNGESCTSVSIKALSPKELVQWIIGTFDTFKLYGRPAKLIDDSNNISALNFGEPMNGYSLPRLFLEIPEVIHLNFKDETLLDNKAQFAGILLHKLQSMQQQQMNYRQSQQPMGLINQIPSGQPVYNNQSPIRPNSQRMSTMPGYVKQQQGRSPINSIHSQQQQSQRMNPASGRVIYASDEDSEEDNEEDEDEESDHDSVYKPQKHLTRESLSLPTMSTEDDGFASSILGNIEKKSVSSFTKQATTSIHSSNTSLPIPVTSPTPVLKDKAVANEDEFGLSDSEDETPRVPSTPAARKPKPKMAATQVSISGSDDDDEDNDDDEGSFSGSDDDTPIHQQGGRHPSQGQQQQQQQYLNNGYPYDDYGNPQMQQQWEQGMTPDMYQEAYYDEDGFPIIDEDGPVIPPLGDRFATQNSLLDSYRPDRPSAHDQEGYARATGQPLIQVPNKPPEPRAGLVGMISQIENEKKHKETNKNRFAADMDKDRMMDRDRDRYMMDQRSSMMVMYGTGSI